MITVPESPVNLEVRLNREFLPVEKEGILFAAIEITPTSSVREQVKRTRPRVHLTFCIDTSDSMAGEKIETAKKAFEERINRSLNDGDLISVVTFSDRSETLASLVQINQESRRTFSSRVRALSVGSSTNLYAGLQSAGEISGKTPAGYLRRIILLTDGNPTTGIMSHDEIVSLAKSIREKYGTVIDVIGIGDDYDPELTRAIALASDGEHYHASSAGEIPGTSQTIVDRFKATIVDRPPDLQIIPTAGKFSVEDVIQLAPEVSDLRGSKNGKTVIDILSKEKDGRYKIRLKPISAYEEVVLALKMKVLGSSQGRTELGKVKFGPTEKPLLVEFTNDLGKVSMEKDPAPRLMFIIGAKIDELARARIKGDKSKEKEIQSFLQKVFYDKSVENVIVNTRVLLILRSKFESDLKATQVDDRTRIDRITKTFQ